MARQRVSIPFGGGLDRLSGHAALAVAAKADLRNTHLSPGRSELRKGLDVAVATGWGTDVIGMCAVRKTGLLAVVVYDSVSRGVRLYSFDGVTLSLVGALWTIDVSLVGHLPRVSVADVYDYIFIAHDERDFSHRAVTKVFDVTNSTVATLQLNLDRAGLADVKFRWVKRHLSYLVAGGYGTAADPNRPETIRISMPGDPLNFVPEHYFLVGARGDPVVGAADVGVERTELLLGKSDEAWRLVGYDRKTFGVYPVDSNYGFISSRAAVTVDGECFAWTLQGPRSSNGGPFADLSLPLDLNGPLPDALAAPTDDAFAWYDPIEQEVIFAFGTWAYVLHLKEGQRRWSYRVYGRALSSTAKLVAATGTGSFTFISAAIGTVVAVAAGYTPGDDSPKFTVPWTLSGAGSGSELVEVWGRAEVFGSPGHLVVSKWTKLGTFTASALTGSVTVPYFLTSFDLAIRVIAGGTPGAGFTNTPDNWPATARATKTTVGAITSFDLTGLWTRRDVDNHGFAFAYVGPGSTRATNPELSFKYEQSRDGGGTWSALAMVAGGPPLAGSIHRDIDAHLVPDAVPASSSVVNVKYKLTVTGPSDTATATGSTAADLAPGAPAIPEIKADTGELTGLRHLHPVRVTAGTHGGPIEVKGRHATDGSWSSTYTVSEGALDVLINLDNTGGLDHVEVWATTRLASGDYSKTTTGTANF